MKCHTPPRSRPEQVRHGCGDPARNCESQMPWRAEMLGIRVLTVILAYSCIFETYKSLLHPLLLSQLQAESLPYYSIIISHFQIEMRLLSGVLLLAYGTGLTVAATCNAVCWPSFSFLCSCTPMRWDFGETDALTWPKISTSRLTASPRTTVLVPSPELFPVQQPKPPTRRTAAPSSLSLSHQQHQQRPSLSHLLRIL